MHLSIYPSCYFYYNTHNTGQEKKTITGPKIVVVVTNNDSVTSHFLISLVLITGASSIWFVVEQHSPPAAMSFVDTLRQWDEAITCAERQDFSGALRILISIQEPNSKICFDLGCLHLLSQDLEAAEKVSWGEKCSHYYLYYLCGT